MDVEVALTNPDAVTVAMSDPAAVLATISEVGAGLSELQQLIAAIGPGGDLWIGEGSELLDTVAISSWTDSIQAVVAAQGTPSARAVAQKNIASGQLEMVCDGTDDDLDVAGISATGSFTQVVFARALLVGLEAFSGSADGTSFLAVTSSGQLQLRTQTSVIVNLTATGAMGKGLSLVSVLRDGSDNLTCRVNGVDVTSGSPVAAGNFLLERLASRGTASFLNGDLASLTYHAASSLGNIVTIENHLRRLFNDPLTWALNPATGGPLFNPAAPTQVLRARPFMT